MFPLIQIYACLYVQTSQQQCHVHVQSNIKVSVCLWCPIWDDKWCHSSRCMRWLEVIFVNYPTFVIIWLMRPASDGLPWRSRQCQLYCSLIWNFIKTWFPFFFFSHHHLCRFLQLIKHRVHTDSFTSLQIWSGFIVVPEPGMSAIEHTGLNLQRHRWGRLFINSSAKEYFAAETISSSEASKFA